MNTELAIRDGQDAFDAKQLAALQHIGVSNASRADQAIFFHQCARTGLDPFSRQIYMIERQGKQTIQTGIDGFRLVARRAADRSGETLGYGEPMWCGTDGIWHPVWLGSGPPAAAKVTVYRNGQPFTAVALMREFQATKRDGTLAAQWAVKPAHMIAKCAEALALRMAFPQDLSGLYTSDELGSEPAIETTVQRVTADEIISRHAPAAEPSPSEPSDEILPAQRKRMFALYNELGITDRDERLADASAFLGHDVASSNELTREQASRLIEYLELRTQGPGE